MLESKNRNFPIVYLIVLDFLWSAAALFVDLPKLGSIYPLLWPLVVICPVYPLLLGIVWLKIKKGQKPNPYLLAFSAIPSAAFGILALVYYPSKMVFQGFDLRDLGQIFWVLFYSLQGWYLLGRFKIKFAPAFVSFLFLCIALIVNFRFRTFGYLSLDDFPQFSTIVLLNVGLVSAFVAALLALKGSDSTA